MPFTREESLLVEPNGDTVKTGVLKTDGDLTRAYTHLNTLNTAVSQKIAQTEKGSVNGVASLDGSAKIPIAQIPDAAVVPVGTVIMFAGETAPAGWWECNGSDYAIADYPALFESIGYLWGGSGLTAKIPDMRGYFPRGWDHGAGVDADRATRSGGDHVGSSQADSVGPHNHLMDLGGQWIAEGGAWAWGDREHGEALNSQVCQTTTTSETRPKNKYFCFIIKYE